MTSTLHPNKETCYTSFRGGSHSFMLSSGNGLTHSLLDKEMNITNY